MYCILSNLSPNSQHRLINIKHLISDVDFCNACGSDGIIKIHFVLIRIINTTLSNPISFVRKYKTSELIISDVQHINLHHINTITKYKMDLSTPYINHLVKYNRGDILDNFINSNTHKDILVKYLLGSEPLNNASMYGHVDLLQWLINTKLPLDYTVDAIDFASSKGHVKVLEWLVNSNLLLKYDYAIEYASLNGHIHVLEWWKNSGLQLKYDNTILDTISRSLKNNENKCIQVLEWWFNSGLPLKYTKTALENASWSSHINVLELWKNSGLPLKYSCDVIDYVYSAKNPVRVLNWWKNSGLHFKYSKTSLRCATLYNRINILEWWKTSGLPLKYDEYVLHNPLWRIGTISDNIINWWKNSGLPLNILENIPENTDTPIDFDRIF
jgi:hypothetical protein